MAKSSVARWPKGVWTDGQKECGQMAKRSVAIWPKVVWPGGQKERGHMAKSSVARWPKGMEAAGAPPNTPSLAMWLRTWRKV